MRLGENNDWSVLTSSGRSFYILFYLIKNDFFYDITFISFLNNV